MHRRTPLYAAAGLVPALAALSAADAVPVAAPVPSAETTFYLAPLDAEGFVDYAAAVNLGLNVPGLTPDQNVFVGILEQADTEHWDPAHLAGLADTLENFFVPLPEAPFTEFSRFAEAQGADPAAAEADFERARKAPFDASSTPLMAAWIDAMGPALDGIAEALRRPHYVAPLIRTTPDRPVVEALLPHLGLLRSAGVAVRTRGHARLAEGELNGATEDLLTLRRLAAWTAHGPALLDGLVSLSIGRLADELHAAIFAHRDFARRQLDAIREAGLPAPRPMDDTVGRFARAMTLDTVTHATRDPACLPAVHALMGMPEADAPLWEAAARVMADPRFDLEGLLGQVNFLYDEIPRRGDDETLAEFAPRVDRYASLLERRRPTADERTRLTAAAGAPLSNEAHRLAESGTFKLLTSSLITLDVTPLRTAETVRDYSVVTELAAAVQDFRLGRGHYPASLDELTPGYVRTLPIDPGDGAALRYVPDADRQGFTLYSVGPDGEDDGGVDDPTEGDLVFRVRR